MFVRLSDFSAKMFFRLSWETRGRSRGIPPMLHVAVGLKTHMSTYMAAWFIGSCLFIWWRLEILPWNRSLYCTNKATDRQQPWFLSIVDWPIWSLDGNLWGDCGDGQTEEQPLTAAPTASPQPADVHRISVIFFRALNKYVFNYACAKASKSRVMPTHRINFMTYKSAAQIWAVILLYFRPVSGPPDGFCSISGPSVRKTGGEYVLLPQGLWCCSVLPAGAR